MATKPTLGVIMDFSKIEGLTEEQQSALSTLFDSELSGIKAKNEELLGEKKTVQQLAAEKDQALSDARAAAAKAEEERLKLAGDVDGLKKHYEEQLANATASANEAAERAKNALLSRDKDSVLNKALGLIHDDYKDVVTDKLSNMLKISYNDQGNAITTFESNGEVVANNIDEFKSWAAEQPSFKKIMNGVNSSGANTQQSGSGASDAGNTIENKLAQRLRAQGIN